MTGAASGPLDASQPEVVPASVTSTADDLTADGASVDSSNVAPEDPAATGAVSAPTGVDGAGRPWPPFAHGSEAEMARILDFYEVRWEYEPRTFPILLNLEGDVVESFSPDFYLPDLDLFLEMTTLKQRLVRKKNRKLRRLRELYPDIRIKLFYARDFRAMLLKYGRLALANSLSGTLGQVMPDRGRELGDESDQLLSAQVPTLEIVQLDAAVPSSATLPDAIAAATTVPDAALPNVAPAPGEVQPALRRNASRSRRRRAAAAARAAARALDATTVPGRPRSDSSSGADRLAR